MNNVIIVGEEPLKDSQEPRMEKIPGHVATAFISKHTWAYLIADNQAGYHSDLARPAMISGSFGIRPFFQKAD